MANGGHVRGWLSGGGTLVDRLSKIAEAPALADELYLSVLTRRPTPAEVEELAKYLAERPAEQRAAAIGELAWALITSAEFRFNH
jgi:hypothetical protein